MIRNKYYYPKKSNWVCLNTDGSGRNECGFVAVKVYWKIIKENIFWGLIDFWIIAPFFMQIVEHLIWLVSLYDRDFSDILIEIDNFEAIKVIQEKTPNDFNSALIRRIHHVLLHFEQWNIHHVLREDNKDINTLAKLRHKDIDTLAKLTHHRSYDLCLYEDCPLGRMI